MNNKGIICTLSFGGFSMKAYINQITLTLGKLDQRHIRLALILLSLALFALGAGAPEITGTAGG